MQPVVQTLAVDKRHHVVEVWTRDVGPIRFARVVDRNDVGVGEPSRHLDLPEEPGGGYRPGEFR